jgi:HK97 family phage major capsid protein
MPLSRSTLSAGWLPDEHFGQLLIAAVVEQSVATSVGRPIKTGAERMYFPRLTSEAPADFVAEGADLPLGDPGLDDVTVIPAKVAGLTIVTSEAVEDASPEVSKVVGDSLVRAISAKIDQAFVGNLPAPAPKGIASLTDVTDVTGSTPDSLADLDVIADAIAAVQDEGGTPTHILVSPGVAKHLAKLKTGTGSNQPLLGVDATKPTVRTAYGLPLVTVRALTDSALYVVDGSRIAIVLRQTASVEISRDRYFESDRVAVRARARVGFGFLHPETIAKVGVALA